MNFLDRNTLPRFQERLDLAASELNDMEDIYVQAINELAGRIYNIANLVSQEERSQYAEETNYLILDTIQSLTNQIATLESRIEFLEGHYDSEIEEINTKFKFNNYLEESPYSLNISKRCLLLIMISLITEPKVLIVNKK